MNKKNLIIIGVIVLLIVGAIVVVSASSSEKTDGAYNYGNMKTANSFTSYTGYTQTPTAGNVFVVVDMALENQNYGNGISNNPLYFKLNIDGIGYTWPSSSKDIVSLSIGAKITFKLAFEVPAGIDISNASVSWNWVGKVVRDTNLAL